MKYGDKILRAFGSVEMSIKKPRRLNAIEMRELESRDSKLDTLYHSRL